MEINNDFRWSSPDIAAKALISLVKAGEAVRTRVKIHLTTGGVFEKVFYKVKGNPRRVSWLYLPENLRAQEEQRDKRNELHKLLQQQKENETV